MKGSPVHFECRLHQIVTLPGRSPAGEHHVVIGQVVAVHIDDAVLTADGRVDIPKIRPIARLGYKDYVCVEETVPDGQETNTGRSRERESMMLSALLLVTNLAASCESLNALKLPDTTMLTATLVPEGPFTPPSTAATAKPIPMPAACRVVGRVSPAITFEVWMPAAGWNGKFQAVGGGGFAGVISYGAMATALRRGYATASTDTGHSTPGGAWAQGHPELITDFAYRAIHETTLKSKAIVEAFYGNASEQVVLCRMLNRRPARADGSAAFPQRLRRHRRGRSSQLLDAPDGGKPVGGHRRAA